MHPSFPQLREMQKQLRSVELILTMKIKRLWGWVVCIKSRAGIWRQKGDCQDLVKARRFFMLEYIV